MAMKNQIIYDGQCSFCARSARRLKVLDISDRLTLIDLHSCEDIKTLHPDLTKELAMSQIHLIESDGTLYGGFKVFQRLCLKMPVLYLLIPVFYFPGMEVIGPFVYHAVAKQRYLIHRNICCKDDSCSPNNQGQSSH